MELLVHKLCRPGGRGVNEDYTAFLSQAGFSCFVLADGLGGHRGGAVASKTVVESILSSFQAVPGASVAHLEEYLKQATGALDKVRSVRAGSSSFKTTLVVLLIGAAKTSWAHLGDSRLYYFKAGRLLHQTKDHSVPQRLADSGEISYEMIRFHEDRNRLTASFESANLNKTVYCEAQTPPAPGDCYLLCSDGFWEYVDETLMQEALKQSKTPERWLGTMEAALLEKAEAGHDNYSALAIMAV